MLRRLGGIKADAAIEVERLILARFRAQASSHLPDALIPRRIALPGWWCLMQHYGVPTRLLDWTKSPYVAAYFAVESEPDHDGAVWVVHPRSVDDAMAATFPGSLPLDPLPPKEYWDPDGPRDLHFIGPTRETDRMTAQQTVFSLSRWVLSDHGALITGAVNRKTEGRFGKLVIPRQEKLTFLRRLAQMNITAGSLFPGIDGLGRSLTELTKLASSDASQGGAIDATTPPLRS